MNNDSRMANESETTAIFADTTRFIMVMTRRTCRDTFYESLSAKHSFSEYLCGKRDHGRAANRRQGGTESLDDVQFFFNVPEFCPWDLR